jgi:hypothetical protein
MCRTAIISLRSLTVTSVHSAGVGYLVKVSHGVMFVRRRSIKYLQS